MAKLTYQKICNYCKTEFTAYTRATKYCSHKCNQRAYKQAKKEEKDERFDDVEVTKRANIQTNILLEEVLKEIKNINNNILLSSKPYLTPNEVCQLLNIGRATYNRLVIDKTFHPYQIGKRRVYIKRTDIDKLFISNIS